MMPKNCTENRRQINCTTPVANVTESDIQHGYCATACIVEEPGLKNVKN